MANKSQYSLFANVPTIVMSRSAQNLSFHHKGSCNLGEIKPFYLQEIYPGDTFRDNVNFQARLASTLTRPIMDNLFIDTFYFFVPHRLVYEHFEQVMGDNSESAWIPEKTYEFPVTEAMGMNVSGSLADSFGLPQGYLPAGLQLAAFRGLALIYNEWFRDQNTIPPVYVHKGEPAQSEVINFQPWSENNYTGLPPKASKFHDVFTSALPSPQKGDPVLVTLGGMLPLDVLSEAYPFGNGGNLQYYIPNVDNNIYNLQVQGDGSGNQADVSLSGQSSGTLTANVVEGTNLAVDLSQAQGVSVNDLRLAFATQRLLERSAMYGTRYREIIRSAFGVDSPDARMQIPEFLAGKRQQLDIGEVWQTSSTVNVNVGGTVDFLGTSSAYSKTHGENGFSKAFVEHGYIIGVYVIRQHHNYTQGIEKFWSRKDRLDFYDPAFANIGLQPIYTSELYANPLVEIGGQGDDVFGYSEAWYDLRSRVNHVTGALSPNRYVPNVDGTDIEPAGAGLDIWTLADFYDNAPVLSKEFLEETPEYLDRALNVPSTEHDQFILDFYHHVRGIRRLPPRSIPVGLGGNA